MSGNEKLKIDKIIQAVSERPLSPNAQNDQSDQVQAPEILAGQLSGLPPESHGQMLLGARLKDERVNLALHFQSSYGNAYVRRLLKSNSIQAKMTVSQPDDPSEVEADRMADMIMKSGNNSVLRQRPEDEEEIQTKPVYQRESSDEEEEPLQAKFSSIQRDTDEEEEPLQAKFSSIQRDTDEEEEPLQAKFSSIQRDTDEEEEPLQAKFSSIQRDTDEEEEPLQAKFSSIKRDTVEEEEPLQATATSQVQKESEEEEEDTLQSKTAGVPLEADGKVEDQINALRGGGQPLTETARRSLETPFAYDFSDERVHTDSESGDLARRLNAEAFTTGKDIFFQDGRYAPDSSNGKRLLAHELTHVVQQSPELPAPGPARQERPEDKN